VTKVVTLLLAHRHGLVAEGLKMLLAAEGDLDVVGLAHHSGQAIALAATHQPTVLVLDAELAAGDLAQTLAAARAAAPATRLLVLAGDGHPGNDRGGAGCRGRWVPGHGPLQPAGGGGHPPARPRSTGAGGGGRGTSGP